MALYKLSPGGDSYSLGQQPESALKKTWPKGVNNRLRIIAPPGTPGDFLFFFRMARSLHTSNLGKQEE